MIKLRVVGAAPFAEQHEAEARLHSIPRKGDHLTVWTGGQEVYVEIDMVTWPTWDDEDCGLNDPSLYLKRPVDLSDSEWEGVFEAIKNRTAP